MDIKETTYVTAIAEAGNLTGAAARLGVSQPTLSVFLAHLEQELDTELFYRENKRLYPTPAGRIYLDAANRIIRIKERVYQSIYHQTHEYTEHLVIGATPFRGSIMLARIFHTFNNRYPQAKVDIYEGYMYNLREAVRSGRIHFALGSCYDTDDSGLDYITISREEVVLCAPAFHPLAHLARESEGGTASIDITAFRDTPFIRLAPGTTIRTITDSLFSRAHMDPTVSFETNNNQVTLNMIREGAGVGFLPYSAVAGVDDDIVYFSMQPRYYMRLSLMVTKNYELTEAEQYLAYLIIQRDSHNPLYAPALNRRAEEICHRFEGSL